MRIQRAFRIHIRRRVLDRPKSTDLSNFLYTNLQFMDIGSEMLNYFESNLGRIEILGSSNKIERIYFNIQSSSLDQWEAPQIRESKRQFIFDVVVDDGGEKGKMEEFVNFCEVSINPDYLN